MKQLKKIFEGEVYEMIKKPGGLIFSHLEEALSDELFVKFKMLDTVSGTIKDITKNVYSLAKFGSNYRSAVKIVDNYITVKAINLPTGKLFLCEQSGSCFLLDTDGSILWTGSIMYKDCSPSDIALYDNCVWASFKDNNVLIRFNLATMREELRIGGERSPFAGPRGIYIDENVAVVSNTLSNNLTKVNLDNFTVEQYYEFEKSVKEYIKVDNYEFVLLEDGIYSF